MPMSAPAATVSLTPVTSCLEINDLIVVEVNMSDSAQVIVGGQFFMTYDTTKLEFVDAVPGDCPFIIELLEVVNPGEIDYAPIFALTHL